MYIYNGVSNKTDVHILYLVNMFYHLRNELLCNLKLTNIAGNYMIFLTKKLIRNNVDRFNNMKL
ncbi:MAG: hypothetical protein JWM44_1257 [Bacilli bacterium]|nr:hypothetical protein [Bacilli bacterium]